ncbi:hypothetical protein [Puniceibacterium sp. IMCC21224]|uniref:hypothetical protein n=1 Tax=Puniceibacterium sp. IMCC21224 TaxID=1618204 RepID=UPI00064DC354|nr:hypothetical protein [Puniceibacterium sp. IMCC21224]KMK68689.1 hypothetical protein IMCC21224_113573 [Puniceibacterium sp. IMCC21224]
MFLPRMAFLLVLLVLVGPDTAMADRVSLLANDGFLGSRGALIPATGRRSALIKDVGPTAAEDGARRVSSLFIDKQGASLFARSPRRLIPSGWAGISALSGTPVERIRQLIGHAESRQAGYNAVQHGATKRPARRPTEMTIAEIYDWIDDTPGQPHAIGRYQFIPATLKRLVTKKGVSLQQVFSPPVQDLLADVLLVEAGLIAMRSGAMERHQFMDNLAKIWAGLPNSSGKSHYHGFAGNRATMSWAHFDAEMGKIFPG